MKNAIAEIQSIRANSVHTWLITASIAFLSAFGVILALICIYALPNGSVQPKLGSIFFICSTLVIAVLCPLIWKKEQILKRQLTANSTNGDLAIAPIQEGLSDKILKWIVTVFALFFAFDSIAIALICIYALPDKAVLPATGFIYFLGGAFVVGCFVYAVWKRR